MDKNNKGLMLTRFVDWIYNLLSGFLNFFKHTFLLLYYVLFNKTDKNPQTIYYGKNKYTIYEEQIKKCKKGVVDYSNFLIETPIKISLIFLIFYLVYHFSLSDIVKLFLK